MIESDTTETTRVVFAYAGGGISGFGVGRRPFVHIVCCSGGGGGGVGCVGTIRLVCVSLYIIFHVHSHYVLYSVICD
jgi:hypothetical protein